MYSKDKTTIIDRREQLKVKVKSLAAEARIIRFQEQKSWGSLRDELYLHRITELRSEARHSHIAYGLIRGKSLSQLEQKSETSPKWDKVRAMINKYGPAEMRNMQLPPSTPVATAPVLVTA